MATPRVAIDQLPIQATPEDTNEIIVQDSGVTKRLTIAALRAVPSQALTDHLADTDDAHDATAISAVASGPGVDGDNVQLQLGQLSGLVEGKINQVTADGLYVNLDGDTMTGPLFLVTDPTGALEAATKQYVDDAVLDATGGGLTEAAADLLYVNVGGDTMTGALIVPGTPTSALDAVPKQYVDTQVATKLDQATADTRYVNVAGDTMTGALGGTTPTAIEHLTRKDYVDTQVATRLTQAAADTRYVNVTGDTMSGPLNVTSAGLPYCNVADSGRIETLCNLENLANVSLDRTLSTAVATNQPFIGFNRIGTTIGNIRIASTTTVQYNTTSDPRTKTHAATRGINDAAARGQQLGRLAWQGQHVDPDTGEAEGGETWDFLSSHDIEDVAPYAVCGERNAVDAEGKGIWQEVSYGDLVPLLFAALANALDRIDVLEGAAA